MVQGGVGILLHLMRNLCCFEHCLLKPLDTEAVFLQHCTPCRHSVLQECTEAMQSSSSSPTLRITARREQQCKNFHLASIFILLLQLKSTYWQLQACYHTRSSCSKNYCQKYNTLCKLLSHPKTYKHIIAR